MSIHSSGISADEPLVVSPRRARLMLDCGNTRLYELIAARELESYKLASHGRLSSPRSRRMSPDKSRRAALGLHERAENAPRPAGWRSDRAAGINRHQHQSVDTRSPPNRQRNHERCDLADRGFRDPVQQLRRSLLKRVCRLGVIAFVPGKLDRHRRPSADRWRLACFACPTSSILPTSTGRRFPRSSGKIGLRPWPLTLRPPRRLARRDPNAV
jgi:hypothetical protein